MNLEKNQVMKIYIIIILKHHMRVKMLQILIRIIKAKMNLLCVKYRNQN